MRDQADAIAASLLSLAKEYAKRAALRFHLRGDAEIAVMARMSRALAPPLRAAAPDVQVEHLSEAFDGRQLLHFFKRDEV